MEDIKETIISGFLPSLFCCFIFETLLLWIIDSIGFMTSGIRRGSIASYIHSWIGDVEEGSWFAIMQSIAMSGRLPPTLRYISWGIICGTVYGLLLSNIPLCIAVGTFLGYILGSE